MRLRDLHRSTGWYPGVLRTTDSRSAVGERPKTLLHKPSKGLGFDPKETLSIADWRAPDNPDPLHETRGARRARSWEAIPCPLDGNREGLGLKSLGSSDFKLSEITETRRDSCTCCSYSSAKANHAMLPAFIKQDKCISADRAGAALRSYVAFAVSVLS